MMCCFIGLGEGGLKIMCREQIIPINKKYIYIAHYFWHWKELTHNCSRSKDEDGQLSSMYQSCLTSSLQPMRQVNVASLLSCSKTSSTATDLLSKMSRPELKVIVLPYDLKTAGKRPRIDATFGEIHPTCSPATSKRRQLSKLEPGVKESIDVDECICIWIIHVYYSIILVNDNKNKVITCLLCFPWIQLSIQKFKKFFQKMYGNKYTLIIIYNIHKYNFLGFLYFFYY